MSAFSKEAKTFPMLSAKHLLNLDKYFQSMLTAKKHPYIPWHPGSQGQGRCLCVLSPSSPRSVGNTQLSAALTYGILGEDHNSYCNELIICYLPEPPTGREEVVEILAACC